MRTNTSKKLKICLIFTLTILVGIISFNLYKQIKYPGFTEQIIKTYTYKNNATAEYKVYVKSNKLYDFNPLDEGKLYITEFVDYINATFNYEFTGDKQADIKGNYSIIAKVKGFTGGGEKMVDIWEKDFPIIDKKNFFIRDTSKSIKEDIRINLEEYNTFAKEVIEVSKINSQTALTMAMNINIEGETDKGKIEETISTDIVIPLNTSMFEIGGNRNIEKPGAIEETRQIQLPVNQKLVLTYGVIIGLLLIGLTYISFFTKGVSKTKDPQEKVLKQIFKKHGDRLVALVDDGAIGNNNTNTVKSIDDLVRIADEIGKPIMYKYSPDYKEIKRFYVVQENEIYIFEINTSPPEREQNINKKRAVSGVANQDI